MNSSNGRFTFTPTKDTNTEIEVPFYEDARADYALYSRVGEKNGRMIDEAQAEVVDELMKLGARDARFIEGYFGDKPRRLRYMIEFNYGGAPGVIQVAGLPINGVQTYRKSVNIRVQALLYVRDWLKAAVTAQVFSPGSYPLMQYLLVDEHRTVAQYIIEERQLPDVNPALPSGSS